MNRSTLLAGLIGCINVLGVVVVPAAYQYDASLGPVAIAAIIAVDGWYLWHVRCWCKRGPTREVLEEQQELVQLPQERPVFHRYIMPMPQTLQTAAVPTHPTINDDAVHRGIADELERTNRNWMGGGLPGT